MKKVFPVFIILLGLGMFSCSVFKHKNSTAVVRPRYHMTSPKNRWLVDIPIGARHIRILERKRTKVVRMY